MKKIISFTLCIIMVLNLSACAPLNAVLDAVYGNEAVKKAEAIARFGFSDGVLFEDEKSEKEILFPTSDFEERKAETEFYSEDILYNTLSEDEKTLYHAYEYAFEKGYTNILVDDLLIADLAVIEKVLVCFSLDTPLLEQNLRYETGDFTMYYGVGLGSFYTKQAEFDGNYITVRNFDKAFLGKKLTAAERAKEIVKTAPLEGSTAEKAEFLYNYISKNVTYYDYGGDDKNEPENYLYDALITGKTHCDGYANAISLLFNIAGIPCAEKLYTAAEGEVGHTWNTFEIDGSWYNCDATGSSSGEEQKTIYKKYYFAFEDKLQEYTPDYPEAYQRCEKSLYVPIDEHIESMSSNAFYNAAKKAFAANNKKWALVVVDNYDSKSADRQIQKLVDYFYKDVYYYEYTLIEGRTAVLICASDYK